MRYDSRHAPPKLVGRAGEIAVLTRGATLDDAADVVRIFHAARGEMRYLPHLHSKEDDTGLLSNLIRTGHVQIVEIEGGIPGFIVVNDGWLEHIYVEPEHQGRGIGTHMVRIAKAFSPTGLKLWVFEANLGAIAFYEREGFTLRAQRSAAEADNEEGLPDRLYEWQPELNPEALLARSDDES